MLKCLAHYCNAVCRDIPLIVVIIAVDLRPASGFYLRSDSMRLVVSSRTKEDKGRIERFQCNVGAYRKREREENKKRKAL